MSVSPPPAAGWYPDPSDARQRRWWDGISWSNQTSPVPATPGAPPFALLHSESPAPAAPPAQTPYGLVPTAPGSTASVYRPLVPGTGGQLGSGYTPPPIGVWRSPIDTRPYVRGMGDAIRAVFSKYVMFEGRATRAEFWYFALFSALITMGLVFLSAVPILGYLAGPAFFAWGLGILLPSLAVSVRRLRDAGLHWGWLFLSLLPFGGIAVIVLCCQPSKYP
jgi:uncharacterized membrane protein YhaH (DUF805 family)